MPKGEPTRVVRLPVWLLDHLEPQTRTDESVPELITRRLAPRDPVTPDPDVPLVRCQCKVPTLSKVVSNLCTTCHRLR